jgi:hypothetical protein
MTSAQIFGYYTACAAPSLIKSAAVLIKKSECAVRVQNWKLDAPNQIRTTDVLHPKQESYL